MTLAQGTRLGPHEIAGPIGAGGMGEVYRATDTNLKRQVAIKVLPALVAGDTERLARFQREAEVLAALNHPNIAAIYGLEKTPECTALVMELVEGEDLSQRIARGAIPIDEALSMARQIAEALEAAHERGIIHRDLKPANIKVRTDGTVKVLDFGLAKALEPAGAPSAEMMNSPTLTAHATQAGMIVGTAAYMAPEQARGKAVDRRADIWAFGVVLYEMLTGTRAFHGEDVSLTLSQVLQREPDFETLPTQVPARVTQVLRLCLRKDPRQRVGDIRDVRLALEGAFETPAPRMTEADTSATRPARLPWIVAGVVTALAIGLVSWLSLRTPPPPGGAQTMRFEIEMPDEGQIAITPDGSRLVASFISARETGLWVRSLDQLEPLVLKGTERGGQPFWSPDGRWIGFFVEGSLMKVDLLGSSPQTLTDAVPGTRPSLNREGTWGRNGVIIFRAGDGPLLRVSDAGGEPRPATELDPSRGETRHRYPYFLPDGKHFLFLAESTESKNSALMVGALDSKDRTLLMPAEGQAMFAGPNHLLFLRGNTLMAQEFDSLRLELRGEPRPVAGPVPTRAPNSYAVSQNGILAIRSNTFTFDQERQLSTVDRTGKLVEAFGTPAFYQNPTLSADEKRLAFNRADENQDIWVTDIVRRTNSRLTFDPGIDNFPIWSPDSARLVFSSDRDGGVLNLYQTPSGSGGQEALLLKTGQPKIPTDWSRDGRYIVYTETDPGTGEDIWLLPTSGDTTPIEYLRTPSRETEARVSPNGRWLAYRSNESGRDEVYVQSFPKPGRKWQVSTEGGSQPQWRDDGKELFYLSPKADNQFVAVDILSKPGDAVFAAAMPRDLFALNVVTGPVAGGKALQRNSYQVWKGGQQLLLNSSRALSSQEARTTIVVNWAGTQRQ